MKTIHKYQLNIRNGCEQIFMPANAEIIHAGLDPSGRLCIWAVVFPDATKTYRTVWTVGTGHEVPPNVKHFASVLEGPFMWHIFL